MKAVYISEFVGVEGLEVREVPDPPSPVGDQVLVRVDAAGLNRADLLQAQGFYPPPPGYSANRPGLEFAGEIVEVGDNVRGWKPGARVFGITAGEAQAELVLIDNTLLAAIPDSLSTIDAAAVPEAFLTAHDALFTLGGLQSGESILIHAVGSGVGLAALQIANAHGAITIGTSRTAEKLDKCREFGLMFPIATERGVDFAAAVMKHTNERGANLILDLVGAAYFEENLASLAVRGRLILVGLTSGREAKFNLGVALAKRMQITGTVLRGRSVEEKAMATRGFVADVLPMFKSEKIKPNVDKVFAATDVIEAYRYLQSNESFGKVVLTF